MCLSRLLGTLSGLVRAALVEQLGALLTWPFPLDLPILDETKEKVLQKRTARSEPVGVLRLTILAGRDLADKEVFSKSDPYCVVRLLTTQEAMRHQQKKQRGLLASRGLRKPRDAESDKAMDARESEESSSDNDEEEEEDKGENGNAKEEDEKETDKMQQPRDKKKSAKGIGAECTVRTETVDNDLNPIWNKMHEFVICDPANLVLECRVWDKNRGRDTRLGSATLPLLDVWPRAPSTARTASAAATAPPAVKPAEASPPADTATAAAPRPATSTASRGRVEKVLSQAWMRTVWLPLCDASSGHLQLLLEYKSFVSATDRSWQQHEPEDARLVCPKSPFTHFLFVDLLRARGLATLTPLDKPDLFVELTVGNTKLRSSTVYNSFAPVWNENFRFPICDVKKEKLRVRLFERDMASNTFLGDLSITVKDLLASGGRLRNENFSLENAIDGTLSLQLSLKVLAGGPFRQPSFSDIYPPLSGFCDVVIHGVHVKRPFRQKNANLQVKISLLGEKERAEPELLLLHLEKTPQDEEYWKRRDEQKKGGKGVVMQTYHAWNASVKIGICDADVWGRNAGKQRDPKGAVYIALSSLLQEYGLVPWQSSHGARLSRLDFSLPVPHMKDEVTLTLSLYLLLS
eukprot:g70155.t1